MRRIQDSEERERMAQGWGFLRRFRTGRGVLRLLLVFVPIAAILEATGAGAPAVFLASAAAIIPLAELMGSATERLASRVGEGIGGILNATFGNAAEFIIAFVALAHGHVDLVKASLTGSIIGNVLLVFGVSAFVGGLRRVRQTFNRTAASMASTLLMLSTIGLVIPALHHLVSRGRDLTILGPMSVAIAVVLLIAYAVSLVFTLRTHSHLYTAVPHSASGPAGRARADAGVRGGDAWELYGSLAVLVTAAALVAWMSALLVGTVEPAAHALGLTDLFIGVVLVAVIGNAAEHSTAVAAAAGDRMDLAINIALGSSLQIALFVAPALVLLSRAAGRPMDLLFSPFEVVAVGLSVGVLNAVAADGETNWMEGFQLVAVYTILAVAFYFLPA
jgi:Ca2+:H+ antiporter